MTEKEYTLYANNIDEELLDKIKENIDKYNINYTIVQFKDINGEGFRVIGNGDVALVCHFVSKTFNADNDRTPYTKICNNGMGIGVCLLHMNLNKLHPKFIEGKDSKEYLLNRIEDSINWCEKHLSVDY